MLTASATTATTHTPATLPPAPAGGATLVELNFDDARQLFDRIISGAMTGAAILRMDAADAAVIGRALLGALEREYARVSVGVGASVN